MHLTQFLKARDDSQLHPVIVLGDTHGNSVLLRYQFRRYQYRGCFSSTELPSHDDTGDSWRYPNDTAIICCSKTATKSSVTNWPTDLATVSYKRYTDTWFYRHVKYSLQWSTRKGFGDTYFRVFDGTKALLRINLVYLKEERQYNTYRTSYVVVICVWSAKISSKCFQSVYLRDTWNFVSDCMICRFR